MEIKPRDAVCDGRRRSITVSEIYGADVLFSASVSRSCVPSVTFLTVFMGQQVEKLQPVTQAVLIMWASKSALEEMSVSKRCVGLESKDEEA